MRLAVQQLLAAALTDRSLRLRKVSASSLSIRVGERRSVVAARHELLGLLDPIREVRRGKIEPAHAGMQPLRAQWRRSAGETGSRRCGVVVGPQRDRETITLVNAWLHSRVESGHRALGFGEPLRQLDLELRDLLRFRGHPSKRVTRYQPHSELVRVMKNDRVVDRQVERGSRGGGRGHRARYVWCLNRRPSLLAK